MTKVTIEVLHNEIINIKEGQDKILGKIDKMCEKSELHTEQIAEIKTKQNIMWGVFASVGAVICGISVFIFQKIWR